MTWTKEDRKTPWQPRNGRMTSKQKIAYVKRELGLSDEYEALLALQASDWHIATAIKVLRANGR